MRKFALIAVILPISFLLALAIARGDDQPETHEFATELLSVDLEDHSIVLGTADGRVLMVPVKGQALASLENESVRPGDNVMVTCQLDRQGYCEVVTKLVKAPE